MDNFVTGAKIGKLPPVEETEWRFVLLISHYECMHRIFSAVLKRVVEQGGECRVHPNMQVY
ncbi:MAG: hypothetical protein JSU94_16820, partial [Phycisphaerales bacterium]